MKKNVNFVILTLISRVRLKLLPSEDKMADNENQELLERIEKLEKINKELKDEKTELKAKFKGVDVDEFISLKSEFDKLESEKSKLEKANKTLAADLEKTNTLVAEKDANLSKLLVGDATIKTLSGLEKHKIEPNKLAAAQRDINSFNPTVVDGVAMVGEQTLEQFITDTWLNDPTSGGVFATPNENSGGGANGGGGGDTTTKRSAMSMSEKGAYIAEHGNEAYLKLPN